MEEIKKEESTAVAVNEENTSLLNYMDGTSLNKAYKNAQIIASSALMPDTYKAHPENVLIAMDIASRTNFGLMTVCQNLYIVKGKPAWAGQFCVAAIKGCGKYTDIEYIWTGERDSETFGCYLQAKDIATGKTVRGTAVTQKMVKDEGWLDKPGSKWKTMPEQMYKYRAASFFARTECPEVLMGLQTREEVEDVYGQESAKKKTTITLDSYEEV